MRELFEMSFEVVKASLPMFFSGLKLTLMYSFLGIAGSIVVGVACSLVKYFKIAVLSRTRAWIDQRPAVRSCFDAASIHA